MGQCCLSLDPQASQKSLCQKRSPQPRIHSQKVVEPLSGRSLGACPQRGSEMQPRDKWFALLCTPCLEACDPFPHTWGSGAGLRLKASKTEPE